MLLVVAIISCMWRSIAADGRFHATTLSVGIPSLPIGSMEEVLVNATNTVNSFGLFVETEDPNSYTGWRQYDQLSTPWDKKQPLGIALEAKLKTWLTSKVSRMVAKNPGNPTATRFRAYARCVYGLSGTNSHLWIKQFQTQNEFHLVRNGTSYSVPPEAYSAKNLVYFPEVWGQVHLHVPNIAWAVLKTPNEIKDTRDSQGYHHYGAFSVPFNPPDNHLLFIPANIVGTEGTLTIGYTDGVEQVFDLSTGRQAGEILLSVRLLPESIIVSLKGGAMQAVRLQSTTNFVTWETLVDIVDYTGGAYLLIENSDPYRFFRVTFDDKSLLRLKNAP